MAYFRPVIDELRAHPAPEGYLDYLRLKLRQAAAAQPANTQESTLSGHRHQEQAADEDKGAEGV